MASETLFNIPIEEVRRQLKASKGHDYDKDLGPIDPNYGSTTGILDPCIEGGKKILADPETRELVKSILRG